MRKMTEIKNYTALGDTWAEAVKSRVHETALIKNGKPVTYIEADREIASFRMKMHTFKVTKGETVAVVSGRGVSLYKIIIALATRGVNAVILPEETDVAELGRIAVELGLRGAVCERARVEEMNAAREVIKGFVIIDSEVIGDGEYPATPGGEAYACGFDKEYTIAGRCFGGEEGDLSPESFLYLK